MLRSFVEADIAQALLIEEATQITPWTIETFKICLDSGYIGWVLEQDKVIFGFIIVSLRNGDCHVLNLCVRHNQQHHGYGQRLLQHALEQARIKGSQVAYLEVRRSNLRAIDLYMKTNFKLIGERKDYYPTPDGSKEDALVFATVLQYERKNGT